MSIATPAIFKLRATSILGFNLGIQKANQNLFVIFIAKDFFKGYIGFYINKSHISSFLCEDCKFELSQSSELRSVVKDFSEYREDSS